MKQIKWEHFDPKDRDICPLLFPKGDDEEDAAMFLQPESLLVITPMGPVHPNSHIFDKREFFVGYTNFPLTVNIINKIDKLNGVDVLKPLGKHRFIIGIPSILFDFRDIKKEVQKICGCSDEGELNNEVSKTLTELKKNKYWFLYVFPNGKFCYYVPSDDKLNECEETFESLRNISNGQLYSYHDSKRQ